MRASVMAALALGGRLVGVIFEAWQLLSLAVVVLVVMQPELTLSAGFQLSVTATAGVLIGARWPVAGGAVGRALAVTLGAQVAVAPLILYHFGAVPLMSPLVNLVAAPVVTASTLIGAVGVLGPRVPTDIAVWLANLVLFLAAGSEGWPQLDAWQFGGLGLFGWMALKLKRLRPTLAVAGLAVLVVGVVGIGRDAPASTVIVLDVGQGDAILLSGGDGRYALVDGGPDEVVLIDHLRRYGVDRLDLLVLSHVHADHAAGLVVLPDRIEIRQAWMSAEPHETAASASLVSALEGAQIPVSAPQVGDVFALGSLTLVVEGPLRRYASPNDQSIVIRVIGPSRDMLLAGDVEVIAQSELGHLEADVLKVPHQGAATSDPEWLRSVGADVAVVSVGPNQFGHPAAWVIDVLEGSGAHVLRTDRDGNVAVDLAAPVGQAQP